MKSRLPQIFSAAENLVEKDEPLFRAMEDVSTPIFALCAERVKEPVSCVLSVQLDNVIAKMTRNVYPPDKTGKMHDFTIFSVILMCEDAKKVITLAKDCFAEQEWKFGEWEKRIADRFIPEARHPQDRMRNLFRTDEVPDAVIEETTATGDIISYKVKLISSFPQGHGYLDMEATDAFREITMKNFTSFAKLVYEKALKVCEYQKIKVKKY